jgi:hypothetical protein
MRSNPPLSGDPIRPGIAAFRTEFWCLPAPQPNQTQKDRPRKGGPHAYHAQAKFQPDREFLTPYRNPGERQHRQPPHRLPKEPRRLEMAVHQQVFNL